MFEGLREAFEYVNGLKEDSMDVKVTEIAGKTYCNKKLVEYGQEPMASEIEATTLTAMVDYIKNRTDELREHMIIQVKSPICVQLFSGLNKDRKREFLFESSAIVPKFSFDSWYDQERFLIELQADFVVNADLLAIQKVAGNVEAKTTANYGDDGVSQKTTIKQGIASKTDVIVPNPVTLTPYRTFLELEQPESQFVFRIKDSGGEPAFKIVEAEGGLWRNEAMAEIKEYLDACLKAHPVYNRITIIA